MWVELTVLSCGQVLSDRAMMVKARARRQTRCHFPLQFSVVAADRPLVSKLSMQLAKQFAGHDYAFRVIKHLRLI
jgi:hypothetical protein